MDIQKKIENWNEMIEKKDKDPKFFIKYQFIKENFPLHKILEEKEREITALKIRLKHEKSKKTLTKKKNML